MDQRIVFQLEGSQVSVMAPAPCGLSILEIGKKDVPEGVEFWIVDAASVPEDTKNWILSEDDLGVSSGVGGTYNG